MSLGHIVATQHINSRFASKKSECSVFLLITIIYHYYYTLFVHLWPYEKWNNTLWCIGHDDIPLCLFYSCCLQPLSCIMGNELPLFQKLWYYYLKNLLYSRACRTRIVWYIIILTYIYICNDYLSLLGLLPKAVVTVIAW